MRSCPDYSAYSTRLLMLLLAGLGSFVGSRSSLAVKSSGLIPNHLYFHFQGSDTLSGFLGYQTYTWYTDMHGGKTHRSHAHKVWPGIVVVLAFNSSTREAKAGRSLWVQGEPCLHSDFQDSQSYTVKLHLKKQKRNLKIKNKSKITVSYFFICVNSDNSDYRVWWNCSPWVFLVSCMHVHMRAETGGQTTSGVICACPHACRNRRTDNLRFHHHIHPTPLLKDTV